MGAELAITSPGASGEPAAAYVRDQTTVTDTALKKVDRFEDGLGRLWRVVEDPAGLNYATQYQYDPLGNLTSVSQGSQTRTFLYSSVSRLLSATNPESGLVAPYLYDANGNLTSRSDARGVVSTLSC